MGNIDNLNKAKELISRPTAKRLMLAANILTSIIYSEMKGICNLSTYIIYSFDKQHAEDKPIVKLKKFVCAICPSCGSRTFDLNTEIMQGSCLSCSFKSVNYKSDMSNRGNNLLNKKNV